MTDDEREKLWEHINRWRETDVFLEKLRREEIRRTVTSESITAFDDAFRSAIYLNKPRLTLRFVHFYKILKNQNDRLNFCCFDIARNVRETSVEILTKLESFRKETI